MALRGLLMGMCPEQPPPEWFSGQPLRHLALTPLPFRSEHADGRPLRHSRESGNPGAVEGCYSGVPPLHPSGFPLSRE